MDTMVSLTPAGITAAHEKIKPYIHETPLLSCESLSLLASSPLPRRSLHTGKASSATPASEPSSALHSSPKFRLFFKCENFQRTGAFKARGAFHSVLRLIETLGLDATRHRGVTTVSSGNHAQGLALAAATFGIPATIVMPENSADAKIRGVAGILELDLLSGHSTQDGARCSEGGGRPSLEGPKGRIIFCGASNVEKQAAVAEVVAATAATLVPPYEHPDIILGQGTLALELQAQYKEKTGREEPDAVIAPLGGGGLLGGVATWFSGSDVPTKVIGAEPSFEGADDASRALRGDGEGMQRRRIEKVASKTIADGLRTPVGALNWRIVADPEKVWGAWSVGEEEIKMAMKLMMEKVKIVVEPSACVPLAVVLFNEEFRSKVAEEQARTGRDCWDVVLVLGGGNTTVTALKAML